MKTPQNSFEWILRCFLREPKPYYMKISKDDIKLKNYRIYISMKS
ncbi:hypothetical protein SSCHL_2328 [Staphylococcus schleiferi]|nr:hypothetical protein SSCHL_2328 [Staphylococcus schleiferi]